MKKIITLLIALSISLTIAGSVVAAETNENGCTSYGEGGAQTCPDPNGNYSYGDFEDRSYKRMYYTFGIGGSYTARKAQTGIKGNVGAYTNIEYRLAKVFSFGFDSYYGYLAGTGTQYLSSFNPGFKIYPMMYRNPSFEPFLFFGGHVFEAAFGGTGRAGTDYGQGGFAGAGFRFLPQGSPIGIEFFTRASFIYMQRPNTATTTGRGLMIPIMGFIGAVY